MHNDTPLGTTMHLRELDRQGTPKLIPSRAGRRNASPVTAVGAAMVALLRRLSGVGISARLSSRADMLR